VSSGTTNLRGTVPGYEHPDHLYRQLSSNGTWYPKWIPCLACLKPLGHHMGKACPFDTTEFSPDEETIDLILAELHRAGILQREQTAASHGMLPRNVTTPWMAAERYLLAHDVVASRKKWSWKE